MDPAAGAKPGAARYALDPAMPVLLRPDGSVQIGWDPRRAVRVRPPAGLSPGALAAVLGALPCPDPVRLACGHGLTDTDGFAGLLADLARAGVLRTVEPAAGRACGPALSVRVHGCGPLADLLTDGLRCSGARVDRTSHPNAAGAPGGADLVVLADWLGADPRLLRELHAAKVAHLPVRVRDGTGLVGPLVIPGVTSCLTCADLHRGERDAAWPALAAQLRGVVGTADRPTLLATAGLALATVARISAGVRAGEAGAGDPPLTLDTTVEIDVATHAIRARRWPRHPLCGCWHTSLPAARRQG
jgi:bacteriocin biosynthesis cyclodehydratase domain-containing protein